MTVFAAQNREVDEKKTRTVAHKSFPGCQRAAKESFEELGSNIQSFISLNIIKIMIYVAVDYCNVLCTGSLVSCIVISPL